MYEIFIPKSAILQKYIYNFYVMKEFAEPLKYLAFPQVGMTMAFFINTSLHLENKGFTIAPSEERDPKILLLGKYKLPIQLQYERSTPEISINFTPTGLNYFFPENTCDLAKVGTQLITKENWLKAADEIFQQENTKEKIQFLEHFLLDNYVEKDLSVVENYLLALKENPERTTSDIAKDLKVSTKTINRLFAKYVACSPMDFKQILRFRKAVQTKFDNPSENLTQICFDSNFYDSPHFTREFKKLTHLSPKEFFAEIGPVSEQDIPYQFL